jgi:pimeloyl-ACP methyl ester carboxylesterase
MIVFTLMHPDKVRKLVTWCVVGGNFGNMTLASIYVLTELRTVRAHGIEGIMAQNRPGPGNWASLIEANPRNRQRFLDLGAEEFERMLNRWLDAYIPKPNEAIPGVADWEFEQIKVPTLIVRGGEYDYDHPKRTSYEVHALIKDSTLIEPPWPEDAWEARSLAQAAGQGSMFDFWEQGAPEFLKFIDS